VIKIGFVLVFAVGRRPAIGFVLVRPEGACHQRRRVPPRELSIDLVATGVGQGRSTAEAG
jgi:hypothetical protein